MKNPGNRTQDITVKFPWIEELSTKSKENERRRKRRKINKIKENLEELSYKDVLTIDHIIKSMIKTPSIEYGDKHKYKDERRY
jgi:hypothetical protein